MLEKKNIPEIRFKGFDDEYVKRELLDCASKIGDGLHGTPRYVENGGVYFINGNNLNFGNIIITNETKQVTKDEQSKNDKALDENTLLISINGTIGNLAFYHQENIMLGKSVAYIILKNNDKNYVFAYLQNPKIQNHFENNLTGSTIKNLGLKTIRETEVFFPKINEQITVGTFFQNLDKLITLRQQKYDKQITLKKAMLEKMFPKAGASVPEIRFKGFEGDWEEKKLIEVAFIIDGNYGEKYPKDNEFLDFGVPFFTSAVIGTTGMFNKKNVKFISNEKHSILLKAQSYGGDLILTNRGASMGVVAQIPLEYGAVNIGPQLTRIRGNQNYSNLFLLSMLKNPLNNQNILSINSGSAMNFVGLDALGKFEFKTPILDEQKKIGQFFASIDNFIYINQKELEKLKNIKKACLEKMFV